MYNNWEQKARIIGPYQWISVTDLVNYLHELRRVLIFSPRRILISRLPTLNEVDVPCTGTVRFPVDGNYLCETDDWKKEMDLLRLSVDVMINKKKLKRNYAGFKTIGEAETYALGKINEIMALVYEGHDSIMNQEAFENEFDLTWTPAQT